MTLTCKLDLDKVKKNQHAKYLHYTSFSAKVIVQTHRHSRLTALPGPHTHTYNCFMTFFPGLPRGASARKNLLSFYGAREDNRGRHTDHPDGSHSIWTNQRPTSLIPIFTPDALPATTVPLYPGLGQAPNMLACIPSCSNWASSR